MKSHIRIVLSTLLIGVAMSIFSFGHAEETEPLKIRPLYLMATLPGLYYLIG